jgi:microcystin degradation protein MlrC
MRVAIAGFHHETNTFAPQKATWEHFERGEGWPPLTRGAALFGTFPPMNIPIGGFIHEANALGLDLVPILWTAAVPSAHVTEDAYERVAGEIVDGLRAATGSYNAVYLDLHGAMVTEHLEDGEGELLARVRRVVGSEMPVVVSLDLHANVTEAMVRHATALIAYRTYPHLDMAATGGRAARHLHRLLYGWPRQHCAFRRVPFLMPLTAQCTMIEPAKGIYELVGRLESEQVSSVSFATGFPPADIRECGPAVIAYADSAAAAGRAADTVLEAILSREAEFSVPMLAPAVAVAEAMRRAATASRPIVLADVQDNSGAGATSDTTGLLAALVAAGAQGAALGLLTDPDAAAAAHAAGEGAEVTLDLGGKAFKGDPPLRATFRVGALGDGRILCTGPFYGGTRAELGPMARLDIGGVSVAVASRRMQAADKAMFRHLGIEPAAQRILGLKSAVHFRGDFTDIAEDILIVEAPGAFIDRPDRLPYRRLRAGVRLGPRGPVNGG